MKVLLLFVTILIFTATVAEAGIRIRKLTFEGDVYYVVAIYPKKEPVPILGFTRIDKYLILPPSLGAGEAFDPNYEAVEFLMRDGSSLLESRDIMPMSPEIRRAIERARVPHELAQAAERYLEQMIETKIMNIYKTRKTKIDPNYFDTMPDRDQIFQDGTGIVAFMNSKKEVEGAVAYSIRTDQSSQLPTERADGVDFGDVKYQVVDEYPMLTPKGLVMKKGKFLPILTMELKRFGILRKSKVDLLPVLIYFGEINGISREGAPSLGSALYRNTAYDQEYSLVVGRYVMASDEAAAAVYQGEPYNFTLLPEIKGNNGNSYLSTDRANFVGLWDRAGRETKRRLDGRLFIQNSKVEGFMVAPPGIENKNLLSGTFEERPWWELRKDLLKIPAKKSDCPIKLTK